jgi:hypothetical protein
MTEQEWLACTDRWEMLEFLWGRASDRKMRLFSCACCRQVWHLLTDEHSRRAIEVAERHADGQATDSEFTAAQGADTFMSAKRAADAFMSAKQAALLHDIFGNPFCPVALDLSWLTWHDGLIVSMARQMYDSRDFTDMPILADALEEAGCSDQDILGHCRGPGPHVLGCWVVDAILGKT